MASSTSNCWIIYTEMSAKMCVLMTVCDSYMIANECRCCDNKHAFCRSCILAWTMTFGENSQKCPFCRYYCKRFSDFVVHYTVFIFM